MSIALEDLDAVFEQHLGKSFARCQDDTAGCYADTRGVHWLSPRVVTQIVEEILGMVEEPDQD